MTLEANFALARGALSLEVGLSVAAGETVALVGPNGAGKSSCLHAVAGLLPVASGFISLGGRVLDAGPHGEYVAPDRRQIGVVFQEALLFPHMTSLDNVAFGPLSAGVSRTRALSVAATWLERVGLGDCGRVLPAMLSGGQAQRVALARALATDPRALLLDEPLAAVDASAKLTLLREIRSHLRTFEGPRILVAHGIGEAFALADRIAVIEDGRIVQIGTIAEIGSRPRSRYVADWIGLNCFRATGRDGAIEHAGGMRWMAAGVVDGPILVTVHPRAVALYREKPAGSPRNVWPAPIVALEPALDCVRVQVGGGLPLVAEVTTAAASELRLGDKGEVWVVLKATEIGVAPL